MFLEISTFPMFSNWVFRCLDDGLKDGRLGFYDVFGLLLFRCFWLVNGFPR